jgi:glucose/arabinose dehydrogenase
MSRVSKVATVVAALWIPILLAGQSNPPTDANVVKTKAGPVRIDRVASLTEPWGIALLPDGRLLITEKPGRLRFFSDGRLSEPIGGVPQVAYRGQGGLLDVAVDPGFASNGLVYLSYTEAAEQQPADARDPGDPRLGEFQDLDDTVLKGAAVARGRLDGDTLRDMTIVWRQVPKTIGRGHFGGRLVFAPDGKLFITSGDRQRFEPAQDLMTNLGKIIRINSDGTIPNDNPFVNRQDARPDIWSYGHRTPLGAAINPETRQLGIHEMGPLHGDEINIPEPGKNYGWPIVSMGSHYDGTPIPDHATRPEFAAPAFYWHPAISPSGLMFDTGSVFPEWRGSALLGGLSSEALLRVTFMKDGRVVTEERVPLQQRIRAIAQARDGSLLALTDYKDGALLQITRAGAQTAQGKSQP